jgi:hypothetical protein
LGPFRFNMHIHDLPLEISACADVIMSADDTSILISHQNYDDCTESFNHALIYLSKWFQANQLILNVGKINVVKFTTSKSSCYQLNLKYAGKILTKLDSLKFLGMHIDNYLIWHTHIDFLLQKLSTVCFFSKKIISRTKSRCSQDCTLCMLPLIDKIWYCFLGKLK